MVIEPRAVQFWSEIILVISNQSLAARSFDFEITRIISDQIALHSVELLLLMGTLTSKDILMLSYFRKKKYLQGMEYSCLENQHKNQPYKMYNWNKQR